MPWLLIAGMLSAAVSWAGTPGTVAFDYRNVPSWRAIADSGYAMAVLSARGQTAAGGWAGDSLRARGVRVLYVHQPWAVTWGGQLITDLEPDGTLSGLAGWYGAFLRDSTGQLADVQEPGVDGIAYDYRDTAFARAYAAAMAAHDPKAGGWYYDYGDMVYGIPWVWSLRDVAGSTWPAWTAGYRLAAQGTRGALRGSASCWCGPACVSPCDIWPYEGVGPYFQNLISYAKVLDGCRSVRRLGGRGLIFCQRASVPSYRRATAGISLLTDSWFNWREFLVAGGFNRNLRDPEHFELSLGAAPDTAWQRAPGVWQRMFSRGLVLANVGTTSYHYTYSTSLSFDLGPGDALVLQNRDARGRWIKVRTNWGQ